MEVVFILNKICVLGLENSIKYNQVNFTVNLFVNKHIIKIL